MFYFATGYRYQTRAVIGVGVWMWTQPAGVRAFQAFVLSYSLRATHRVK